MDDLKQTLERGKARGYSKNAIIDNLEYLYEFAIKKKNNEYVTYYFRILSDKMDQYEDYADEEYRSFGNLSDAVNFIEEKGGNISLFQPMKGNSLL